MFVLEYRFKNEVMQAQGMQINPVVRIGPFETFDEGATFADEFIAYPERLQYVRVVPRTSDMHTVLSPNEFKN